MPTATHNSAINIAGITINSAQTRSASGQISHQLTLAAGKAGTLTTRSTDTSGIITLGAGHGLEVDDVLDLYWATGLRYGMDIDAVNGNAITISGGAGDLLPALDSAIVACEVAAIDTDFDGDLMEMIAAHSTRRGHLAFRDVTPTVLKAVELAAGEDWSWASGLGITNPLAGNPVNDVCVSNGDSENTAVVKIGVLYDSES